MATLTTTTEQLYAALGSGTIGIGRRTITDKITEYTDTGMLSLGHKPNHDRTGFLELAHQLCSLGIEPADAAAYENARANLEYPPPAEPDSVLRCDVQELNQYVRDRATWLAGQQVRLGDNKSLQEDPGYSISRRLDNEMLRSMQAEVDEYIDLLRPAFDLAADRMRAAAAAGITTRSTPDQVMRLGPNAIDQWIKITDQEGAHKVLNAVAGLRIRMSTELGALPLANHRGQQRYRIRFEDCFGGGPDWTGPTAPDWKVWLQSAKTLQLRSIPDLEQLYDKQGGGRSAPARTSTTPRDVASVPVSAAAAAGLAPVTWEAGTAALEDEPDDGLRDHLTQPTTTSKGA